MLLTMEIIFFFFNSILYHECCLVMRCFFGNKSISTATTIHGNVSYAMKRNKNLGKLAKVSKSLQGHATMRGEREAKNQKHALTQKHIEI